MSVFIPLGRGDRACLWCRTWFRALGPVWVLLFLCLPIKSAISLRDTGGELRERAQQSAPSGRTPHHRHHFETFEVHRRHTRVRAHLEKLIRVSLIGASL